MMKIGIIGSGNMGRSLGLLWAEQGHEIFFGARTTEKGQSVAAFVDRGTQGGTNDEAATFGDVLLYTVRGVNPAQVLTTTEVLSGKILIDCNNFEIPEGFVYPPIVQSLAERLASEVPNSYQVRVIEDDKLEVCGHQ
jgi:8-hydroxy-5-deazaflavin:NADPH oxidoreductase